MLATEKKIVWDLLKKSAEEIYSYTPTIFINTPTFTDDNFINKNVQDKQQNAQKEQVSSSLSEKIRMCTFCSLSENRTNTVEGEGVLNPLVLVIGEAPGEQEDKTGLPFVGAAGQLLNKMLQAINLSRNKNCYIANILKCRPPNNRVPQEEEIKACLPFLKEQIKTLNPKMILLMGKTACKAILNTNENLSALRGKFFSYNDIPLLASYHPSALLRDESLKKAAWEDLKLFRSKLLTLAPNYAAN
ncbi:MAG: uracil-DNA glycosylase [Treponema sp.]|nr:uracil-DNA glycosylase [Treponema sp.]